MMLLLPGLRRLGLGLLLAGAGLPGTATAATADALKAHYSISLIGLPIGAAAITGRIDPSAYRVELSTRLTGLASLLSSSKGAGTATGTIANGRLAPASYATTSTNATMTRTLRMAMKEGTVSGVEIMPPFDATIPRVPVTAADRRDILDPLSAFVMQVPPGGDVVGPAACNRTLPMFDGATRFDLTLSYVGTRSVKAKGYSGPVSVCAVRFRPISGHRADGAGTKFMTDNKDIEVWLAPLGATRTVFPFRISVMTLIGTTVIEADDFSVDETARAATPVR